MEKRKGQTTFRTFFQKKASPHGIMKTEREVKRMWGKIFKAVARIVFQVIIALL